jgi:hypoxia-inducible factor (prolyl hydroxylase)
MAPLDQAVVERDHGCGLILVRYISTGLTEWRFADEQPGRSDAPSASVARGKTRRARTGARAAHAARADDGGASAQLMLDKLRAAWVGAGKLSTWWWWLTDPVQAAIGRALDSQFYVVLDDFLHAAEAQTLARDVAAAHAAGRLKPGALAGGRDGSNLTYTHAGVRGDHVGWFDGDEPWWPRSVGGSMPGAPASLASEPASALTVYLHRLNVLMRMLQENNVSAELRGVHNRSNAMLACYPGGGTRYVRHCDNACLAGVGERCNGRRVTMILYLNEGWREQDGGQLRIFPPSAAPDAAHVAEIAPRSGRLLLFLSDYRVPHEVMPTNAARLAITTWFYDTPEFERARAAGHEAADGAAGFESERAKIGREIAKFDHELGAAASIVRPACDPANATGPYSVNPSAPSAASP